MKAIPRKHNSTLLCTWSVALIPFCLMMTLTARAGEPEVEKKKTYSKSYTVSSNDKISISNQFGELKINTWDKNEAKIDVTITAEASTDEKAQDILDRISIEDGKNGSEVYFKTKFSKEKDKNWGKGEKQSFHIDYVAYVPARNPLNAHNEFGPMTIGDFNGEVWLQSKFDSLTTGKLTNVKKLNVEFGKANIGSISNGKVEIKFSKASIDNLDGDVDVNFEFCDVARLKIDNDTKEVDINNKFSQLYLDVNTNISANFEINTSFGELKNKTNFQIREEGEYADDRHHGPKFDKKYTGKTGSGSTTMKIRSEYGQVTLGHNLSVSMDKNSNRNNDRIERDDRDARDAQDARDARKSEKNERKERKRTTSI
jgi:hypothetical protein